MSLEWEQVAVDARDPAALGRWWADLLDWEGNEFCVLSARET